LTAKRCRWRFYRIRILGMGFIDSWEEKDEKVAILFWYKQKGFSFIKNN
jgi:hypothetical protein